MRCFRDSLHDMQVSGRGKRNPVSLTDDKGIG